MATGSDVPLDASDIATAAIVVEVIGSKVVKGLVVSVVGVVGVVEVAESISDETMLVPSTAAVESRVVVAVNKVGGITTVGADATDVSRTAVGTSTADSVVTDFVPPESMVSVSALIDVTRLENGP